MIDVAPSVAVREPGVLSRLSPRTRWILVIAGAVLVVLIILRSFVIQFVEVEGASMEPTLDSGAWVWVDKVSGVGRGDIVVFEAPAGSRATHAELIKRVIAGSGERVAMRNCVVYVGGVAIDEPYVLAEPTCGTGDVAEVTVGDDEVYVLGDHRSDSLDSRVFGPVPRASVKGRVRSGIWPF